MLKIHPVTVSRVESDDLFEKNQVAVRAEIASVVDQENIEPEPSDEELLGTLKEALGNVVVEAEVSTEEIDAAKAATEAEPAQLPAFEDMTILEMRSHLYLLHGVYAADLKSRDETIGMHAQAHADHDAGRLKSRHVPHVHAEVK